MIHCWTDTSWPVRYTIIPFSSCVMFTWFISAQSLSLENILRSFCVNLLLAYLQLFTVNDPECSALSLCAFKHLLIHRASNVYSKQHGDMSVYNCSLTVVLLKRHLNGTRLCLCVCLWRSTRSMSTTFPRWLSCGLCSRWSGPSAAPSTRKVARRSMLTSASSMAAFPTKTRSTSIMLSRRHGRGFTGRRS